MHASHACHVHGTAFTRAAFDHQTRRAFKRAMRPIRPAPTSYRRFSAGPRSWSRFSAESGASRRTSTFWRFSAESGALRRISTFSRGGARPPRPPSGYAPGKPVVNGGRALNKSHIMRKFPKRMRLHTVITK